MSQISRFLALFACTLLSACSLGLDFGEAVPDNELDVQDTADTMVPDGGDGLDDTDLEDVPTGPCGFVDLTTPAASGRAVLEAMPPELESFTIEAWLLPGELTGNQNVIGRYGEFGVSGGYSLFLENAFPQLGMGCALSGFERQTSNISLQTGVWQHIAVTFDAPQQRGDLFVNGVYASTMNVSVCLGAIDVPSNVPFQIGYNDPSGGGSYLGGIDEVRVSSVVRYLPGQHFDPPTRLEADEDTVLLYNFDPGPSPFADNSGNGRTASIASGFAALVMECGP